jgi:hypothetical protein
VCVCVYGVYGAVVLLLFPLSSSLPVIHHTTLVLPRFPFLKQVK